MAVKHDAAWWREYRAEKKRREAPRAVTVDETQTVKAYAPLNVHAACDQKIADLQAQLRESQNALRQMRGGTPANGPTILLDMPRGGDAAVASNTPVDRGAANQGPSALAGRGISAAGTNPATAMRGMRVARDPDAPSLVHPTTGGDMVVPTLSSSPTRVKPSFLAAPDEDCVCGHDRHAYHVSGACGAWVNRKRCDCQGFMADLHFE